MTHFEVSFQGFDAGDDFLSQYKRALSNLLEKVPADSALSSMIEKQGEGFWGSLRINAHGARFSAKIYKADLGSIARMLIEAVDEQIISWKIQSSDYFSTQPAFGVQEIKVKELQVPKVLLVDDEPNLVEIVQESFRGLGCEITAALNGKQAISELMKEPYDLIILDWSMPGFTGGEALEELQKIIEKNSLTKKLWKGKKIPVVIHSGLALTDTTFPDTENFAIIDHWKKPLQLEQMITMAEDLLKRICQFR